MRRRSSPSGVTLQFSSGIMHRAMPRATACKGVVTQLCEARPAGTAGAPHAPLRRSAHLWPGKIVQAVVVEEKVAARPALPGAVAVLFQPALAQGVEERDHIRLIGDAKGCRLGWGGGESVRPWGAGATVVGMAPVRRHVP